MRRAAIVSPLRTAVGKFQGGLSSITAGDLGAVILRALVERTKLDPERVDGVAFPAVVSASQARALRTLVDAVRVAPEVREYIAEIARSTRGESTIALGASPRATVALMRRTIRRLRPQDIIDVFNEVRGRGQTANMWSKLKTDTVAISADGVLTLACLWSSAWTLARAEKKFTAKQACKAIDRRVLADLYNDPDIAAANWLKDM